MNTSLYKKVAATVVAILLSFVVSSVTFAADTATPAESQTSTGRGFLLPKTQYATVVECEVLMHYVNAHYKEARDAVAGRGTVSVTNLTPSEARDVDILGCAIKTGDISLWMVVFYVRFFLEFVIGLAGVLAVAGIVYGGYLYLFAGISEDKDKGKSAIKNALIGLVLTLTAWVIVNVVIALVTL